MTPTTQDRIEDRQALIYDIKKQAEALVDALENAECCETPKDFDANVEEAIGLVKELAKELEEVLS